MIRKDFIVKTDKFNKRKLTVLQHKLRVVMKCYTVTGFTLNENDNSFVFNKSHRINGLRMDDPKQYTGSFEIEQLNEEESRLLINVG